MKIDINEMNDFYIQVSVLLTKYIMYWKKGLIQTKCIAEESAKNIYAEAISDSMEYSESYRKYYTLSVLGMLDVINMRWLHGIKKKNIDLLVQIRFWVQGMHSADGFECKIGKLIEREAVIDIQWFDGKNQIESVLDVGTVVGFKIDSYWQACCDVQNDNIMLVEVQMDGDPNSFFVENLTFIPLDKDALDISLMNHEDIVRINKYQQKVYEVISPYLTKQEQQWLDEECEKIAFS